MVPTERHRATRLKHLRRGFAAVSHLQVLLDFTFGHFGAWYPLLNPMLAYPAADVGPEIGEPAPDDEGLTDEDLDALEDFAPTQGIRQNPPVAINNWDAPPSDSDSSEGEDEDGELERDPEYLEHDLPPGLDPIDEPGLTDEEIRRRLNLHLGDLADDEWADMSPSIEKGSIHA
ncbi:hypothetical protein FRC12_019497 [Ceratobasidium sp. 428]|nr:hypothetical protein FRC12_019497 [Ceratobasidium sp. 428]